MSTELVKHSPDQNLDKNRSAGLKDLRILREVDQNQLRIFLTDQLKNNTQIQDQYIQQEIDHFLKEINDEKINGPIDPKTHFENDLEITDALVKILISEEFARFIHSNQSNLDKRDEETNQIESPSPNKRDDVLVTTLERIRSKKFSGRKPAGIETAKTLKKFYEEKINELPKESGKDFDNLADSKKFIKILQFIRQEDFNLILKESKFDEQTEALLGSLFQLKSEFTKIKNVAELSKLVKIKLKEIIPIIKSFVSDFYKKFLHRENPEYIPYLIEQNKNSKTLEGVSLNENIDIQALKEEHKIKVSEFSHKFLTLSQQFGELSTKSISIKAKNIQNELKKELSIISKFIKLIDEVSKNINTNTFDSNIEETTLQVYANEFIKINEDQQTFENINDFVNDKDNVNKLLTLLNNISKSSFKSAEKYVDTVINILEQKYNLHNDEYESKKNELEEKKTRENELLLYRNSFSGLNTLALEFKKLFSPEAYGVDNTKGVMNLLEKGQTDKFSFDAYFHAFIEAEVDKMISKEQINTYLYRRFEIIKLIYQNFDKIVFADEAQKSDYIKKLTEAMDKLIKEMTAIKDSNATNVTVNTTPVATGPVNTIDLEQQFYESMKNNAEIEIPSKNLLSRAKELFTKYGNKAHIEMLLRGKGFEKTADIVSKSSIPTISDLLSSLVEKLNISRNHKFVETPDIKSLLDINFDKELFAKEVFKVLFKDKKILKDTLSKIIRLKYTNNYKDILKSQVANLLLLDNSSGSFDIEDIIDKNNFKDIYENIKEELILYFFENYVNPIDFLNKIFKDNKDELFGWPNDILNELLYTHFGKNTDFEKQSMLSDIKEQIDKNIFEASNHFTKKQAKEFMIAFIKKSLE